MHIGEQTLGPEHLDVAESQHNLANLYAEQGKYAEARSYYQRALRVKEALLEPEHPSLALSLHCLVNLSAEQGKYVEAITLYQQARQIYQQTPIFLHSYEVFIPWATWQRCTRSWGSTRRPKRCISRCFRSLN